LKIPWEKEREAERGGRSLGNEKDKEGKLVHGGGKKNRRFVSIPTGKERALIE